MQITKTKIMEKINKTVSVFTIIPVFAFSGIGATTQTVSVLSVPFLDAQKEASTSASTTFNFFKEILDFKKDIEDSKNTNDVDKARALKIDKYFKRHNLPLTGQGEVFVEVANKYNLDWKLLPAIAMRESTGGKFSCPGGSKNVFGWHSCKTYFSTYEEAIDKVGAHLAGEIKSTAGYYKNKTIPQKLKRYNSVIPDYTEDIYSIMNTIDTQKIEVELALK